MTTTATASVQPVAVATEPPPLAITTSPNVDENLFMVQLLDGYYSDLPSGSASHGEIVSWLSTTKRNVEWARSIIRERGLDQDVDGLYEDCLRFVDAYEKYLVNVGIINRNSDQRAVTDGVAGVWKGYKDSSEVESVARRFGASKDDAEGFGALGGVISALVELSEREQKRNEARDAAVASHRQALNDTRDAINSRTRSMVSTLARRYSWAPGEAGFDDFTSRYLREYVRRRPRDPFLKIRYANIRVDKESAGDVLRDAYLCVRAAELVPGDHAYDSIRNEFVANAADLACVAASTEAGDGGYSAHPSKAAEALLFANAYLQLDRQDASGRGHVALARALAFSGRYKEAAREGSVALEKQPSAWRENGVFCYRYACITSLANEHVEYVDGWLRRAYADGYNQIQAIRGRPDFENFRKAYPEEYRELTTAKVSFRVIYGILNDDIVLSNDSPFGVTNLSANLVIRKGSRSWTPQLTCKKLAPGESCKAVDVVSIPNDSYDDASMTFDCDQCEK